MKPGHCRVAALAEFEAVAAALESAAAQDPV